ncbi:MAG: TetR/AcrR family transcriptional regulator [Sulfurimonas sp.]
MAIIVDKEKKRNDIACACKDILLEHGIKNLTVSQIAKTANIGKGTVYEYFKNKEEIVFEIMTAFITEYEKNLSEIVSEETSVKKKLFHFLYLGFEDEESRRQLTLYREFLAISMTSGTDEMIDFNIQCRKKFADILGQILKDGIKKGELPPETEELTSAILAFALGLIVEVHTAALDPKDEITHFLNTLFKIIEIKEKK